MPALEALLLSRHALVGLVTQPDRPRGRSGRAAMPPAKAHLVSRGLELPVVQPEKPRGSAFRTRLRQLGPDVSVVAAYGHVLGQRILDLPRLGSLNLHASLLPRHRGAAPVAAALLAGDEVTGITLMRMERGLDTGPILLQREMAILPGDSAGDLTGRLGRLAASVLVEGLDALAQGRLAEVPQDEGRATYAPRLTSNDARVRWNTPAAEIERAIRAFDPWPGAFTELGGRRVKLFRAAVAQPTGSASPANAAPAPAAGEVLSGPGLRVATGCGILEVLELQIEGRPRVAAADFLRGRPVRPGTLLA
ncbi:MAG: methionyl-tRNA formyltransferase [Gemmatimonadetes bacterium]|nr:methionyl-tRNA formyltransferase [Gemmatimonadota bacterium]